MEYGMITVKRLKYMINIVTINDINIPDLQIYNQMRENAFTKDNSFVADSPKVVNMLLETSIEVKSILATQSYYDEFSTLLQGRPDIICYVTTKEMMQGIVGHKIHHNCMMHGIRPNSVKLDDLDTTIVMLDGITSNENIGSIARSAAALGVNSYLVPKTSPHPFNRRALRVSMGHSSLLKTSIYDDAITTIKTLQAKGYQVFAAEVGESSIPLQEVVVPEKWVILMGHEGKGLSDEIQAACDHTVMIEMMPDIKSFNVGVAAALLMYHFVQTK